MGHHKICDTTRGGKPSGAELWTGDGLGYLYVKDFRGDEHHLPKEVLCVEYARDLAWQLVGEVEQHDHDTLAVASALRLLRSARIGR